MNNSSSILETAKSILETAKQYMTADTAMQSFMMTYEMLNDAEKPIFIERLKIELDKISK